MILYTLNGQIQIQSNSKQNSIERFTQKEESILKLSKYVDLVKQSRTPIISNKEIPIDNKLVVTKLKNTNDEQLLYVQIQKELNDLHKILVNYKVKYIKNNHEITSSSINRIVKLNDSFINIKQHLKKLLIFLYKRDLSDLYKKIVDNNLRLIYSRLGLLSIERLHILKDLRLKLSGQCKVPNIKNHFGFYNLY